MLATGFIGQTRPNPTSLIWMVHPVQIDPPFLKPSESIGMVRLDGDKGSKEVSIFIEREWRGRGLGLSALSWAIKDEPHVEAIVRKDNAASQKLFRRAGFVPEIETPTVTIFAWRRAADA
jgi:RimJ/RimL family protein N-acetyltransferase